MGWCGHGYTGEMESERERRRERKAHATPRSKDRQIVRMGGKETKEREKRGDALISFIILRLTQLEGDAPGVGNRLPVERAGGLALRAPLIIAVLAQHVPAPKL